MSFLLEVIPLIFLSVNNFLVQAMEQMNDVTGIAVLNEFTMVVMLFISATCSYL